MTSPDTRTLLANALAEIRSLRARLEIAEGERHEPVAILGMGCRFPGGADSPEAFWEMLAQGSDTVREPPEERWGLRDGADVPLRWGAFLEGVDQFDPMFFGISPREAATMDPQQRLFLEVAVEALERAGQPLNGLLGSRTGVYVGLCNNDYVHLLLRDPRQVDTHAPTGVLGSVLSGRLAYVLGLEGPSLVLDTGCSASLVAVHLAVCSLRNRETDMAVAGAVNLILSSTWNAVPSRLQAFAPDGKCKTFDAAANGTVRGEGCGVIVLKRLPDALRDGDPIRAVIRGSAVNQDGRSTSLTSPNVLSQQAVIREALVDSRLCAEDVGFVETHGTGTSLGDPIEFEALKATYGVPRKSGSRCALGAVKTNIGHLESAAGIAGLIKAVISLERGAVPPNLHFRSLNPRISLDNTPFVLPASQPLPWPGAEGPRHCAVSSFGIGGTNAHVVLEQAPQGPLPDAIESRATLLALSAKTEGALSALAKRWMEWLSRSADSLEELAASAAQRRSHFDLRLAVVGSSKEEVAEGLAAFLAIAEAPRAASSPRVAFVFQGLGGQWPEMAKGLLATEPVFRQALERCDAAIRAEINWSVLDELRQGARLEEHALLQPILFSMQVALAQLLMSWGIAPSGVVGHSVGEIAAAYVAGALTLEDAVRVICRRSELHDKLGNGGMALVALSLEEAQRVIENYKQEVVVAASNGPMATVLSGATAPLEEIVRGLEGRGVFCRLIKSLGAGHSPQVDPLREELVRRVSVQPGASNIPFYSTVRAERTAGEQLDTNYWGDNMREPVMFGPAIEHMLEDGIELFLELGPHPILVSPIEDTLLARGRKGVAVAAMRRNVDERETLLRAVGALYSAGVGCDFKRLFAGCERFVPIPTYAWDHESYWIERSAPVRRRILPGGHPLLGPEMAVAVEPAVRVFEAELDVEATPFLRDHRVAGSIVFPGAGYLDLAWAASKQAFGAVAAIENIRFERLLMLREGTKTVLQVVLVDRSADVAEVYVSSGTELDRFERHFQALVRRGSSTPSAIWPSAVGKNDVQYTGESYYEALGRVGLSFGPAFTGVTAVTASERETTAVIRVPEVIAESVGQYAAHPALLDICFQAMGHFITEGVPASGTRDILLPTKVQRIVFHDQIRETTATVRARRAFTQDGAITSELAVTDSAGRVLIEVEGFTIQRLGRELLFEDLKSWLHVIGWPTATRKKATRDAAGQAWMIFADDEALSASLANELEKLGAVVVRPSVRALEAAFEHENPFAGSRRPGSPPVRGVVFALGHAADAVTQGAGVCAQLARLVRHISDAQLPAPPRLFVVTQGAVPVEGVSPAALSLVGAQLHGMTRSLSYEHADLTPTIVDLDPGDGDSGDLASILLNCEEETCVAVRGRRLHHARLEAAGSVLARTEFTLEADGTYLLTGGLGGFGLSLARYLVDRGARHLVLAGREPPGPEARAAIADIEDLGADVEFLQVDVADAQQVRRMFETMDRDLPKLRGVFHLAVVLDDGAAVQLDESRIAKVFAPKVLGAHNLHVQTEARELDYFVLLSSASSILGSPGQASYAAANAYLDALAEQRRAMGLPALSVNLGVLGQAAGHSERLEERGAHILSDNLACTGLGRLVRGSPLGTVGLFRFDFARWGQFYPFVLRTPFFGCTETEADAGGAEQLRLRLQEAVPARRLALIEQHVRHEVGRVLRIAPQRFEAQRAWASYGIDSLMGLEIRNRLEATLGISLPPIVLYAEPNLASLSARIASQFEAPTGAPDENEAVAPVEEASRAISELSEEEAQAELMRRLHALRSERRA